MAVDFRQSTFCILLIQISYKNVLPSATIKIRKSDCFKSLIFLVPAVDVVKSELAWLPLGHDLSLVWHCTCLFFYKIDCSLFQITLLIHIIYKIDCRFLCFKNEQQIWQKTHVTACVNRFVKSRLAQQSFISDGIRLCGQISHNNKTRASRSPGLIV